MHNNECRPPETPCPDCTQTLVQIDTLCDTGCVETVSSDCVEYVGDNIVGGTITISRGDNLTKIIEELSRNNLDVTLDIAFNATTRQLCLTKNGVTVRCVNIPDSDDEYLQLDGTVLKIFKPGSSPILINSVDLSSIIPAPTQLNLTSSSLNIVLGGTAGHTGTINLVPSTDIGNILKLGTDGKPYVPNTSQTITDVAIQDTDCLTWAKTFSNGVITYVPTIDWACVAAQVCPICADSCSSPSSLTVQPL